MDTLKRMAVFSLIEPHFFISWSVTLYFNDQSWIDLFIGCGYRRSAGSYSSTILLVLMIWLPFDHKSTSSGRFPTWLTSNLLICCSLLLHWVDWESWCFSGGCLSIRTRRYDMLYTELRRDANYLLLDLIIWVIHTPLSKRDCQAFSGWCESQESDCSFKTHISMLLYSHFEEFQRNPCWKELSLSIKSFFNFHFLQLFSIFGFKTFI